MTASDTRAPWYADGLTFACTRCGNCCSGAPGYVWVGEDERVRLAAFLGLSPQDFHRRHVRRVGLRFSLLEKPDGDCEFLVRHPDRTTSCAVHAARPAQCRTWPFWKSNLKSPADWARTAADCPGINHGPSRPLPVIRAALAATRSLPL